MSQMLTRSLRPVVLRAALPLVITLLVVTMMVSLWGAVQSAPADLDVLRDFLLDPACADASTPCWLGLELGVTSVKEALARLEEHPWVDEVEINELVKQIAWRWSANSPAFLTAEFGNGIGYDTRDYTINQIYLDGLQIPYASFWQVMGQADTISMRNGTVSISEPDVRRHMDYFSFFEADALQMKAWSQADCPVQPYTFWEGMVIQVTYGASYERERLPSAVDWQMIYNTPGHCAR